MDIQQYMHDVGRQAREASRAIARADSNAKNEALRTIAARMPAFFDKHPDVDGFFLRPGTSRIR